MFDIPHQRVVHPGKKHVLEDWRALLEGGVDWRVLLEGGFIEAKGTPTHTIAHYSASSLSSWYVMSVCPVEAEAKNT